MMGRAVRIFILGSLAAVSFALPWRASAASPSPPPPTLQLVASTDTHTWNGVAVANDGRIFVNFPSWVERTPGVAVLDAHGVPVPYPGVGWNSWSPGQPAAEHFVSVNSLYIDRGENHLWVTDPATPHFAAIVEGGPKLVEIDLATDKVVHVYHFDDHVAPHDSYLNDIRIVGRHVFVTESGTGAILVLDRDTGAIRRLLADTPLTKADPSIVPHVDGRPLVGADGKAPRINADQIELSADRRTLFFMSPFGPNLYRVAVSDLLDTALSEAELERRVRVDRHVPPVGGLVMDSHDTLYLSEIETHSIHAEDPHGRTLWRLTDPRLDWPDAYSITPDGMVYLAVAQVDRLPAFHGGTDGRHPPYLLFRFHPGQAGPR
ncbi:SMP-30/gluconolactonase/LRE family protein [Gluconacetobacter tumulisoli]|uniref:Gluconolactonase n=1 Tax=Gluconacetobacter tumulisoli TaxID=1286189 RepID=A0A7W4PKS1_9PROT|nr:L-dopachrome tautomerase-related protein [Gluconacetobacter tumulisoli]MBB2201355.1 hypothetical protein [Gluconacetobacter tumulisoli]